MLKALADETRWHIVQYLLGQDRARVTEIAAVISTAQPSVSKHLRILREAGIVQSTKESTVVWCAIVPAFRKQLHDGSPELNLGCCTFRFSDFASPAVPGASAS